MNKILFCDIDNTLTETISGSPFKQSPSDIKIIEGADKAIAYFSNKGWTIIGISNQGGVAAGHKSIEDTIEEMANTLYLFPGIQKIYFCPDFEGFECWKVTREKADLIKQSSFPRYEFEDSFRKPGAGIFVMIWKSLPYVPGRIWMIGDREEDAGFAKKAGIPYCPADVWRSRFLKGIQELSATPAQLEFLEGIKL